MDSIVDADDNEDSAEHCNAVQVMEPSAHSMSTGISTVRSISSTPKTTMDSMVDAEDNEDSEHCNAVQVMWRRSAFVCMAQWAHMLQYLLTVQAVTQLWIDGFAGNFAGMAQMQGGVSSLKSVVTLCAAPSVGALSDAIGRKPLLMMEPLCDLCQRAVTLPAMSWRAQAVADSVGGSLAGACHSGWNAALGDLWSTKPTTLGAWHSRLML